MGRIKSTLIKRSTKEIMNLDRSAFSNDFEHNKKAVSGLVPGISKKVRNSIAGYISRIIKRQKS